MSQSLHPDRPVQHPDVHDDVAHQEPKMYRVVLHNDHYTTMQFVVEVLIAIFHKAAADATRIMLDVHRKGRGTCGVFTYDIAMTKIDQVHQLARKHEFPLKCSAEEA
jgi:ATP-dependent Clp protease adaptor protein ClpS